ncbi:hypothetical protein U0070_004569 [Myodes glareolus]|uniref:G2/mitotic-specific cyclin-B1 n=1 Tax=Myodes glareolus TaxID=447135 RepID=A0AAW0ICQ2_MYOGA
MVEGLTTQLPRGAMALRVTRNTKLNMENKAKVSKAGAKCVSVAIAAASKPGLRPRTALGDIGNKDTCVSKKMPQLVGVTTMFIASKYEKMHPSEIGDFAFGTKNTYTKHQIRQMEMKILRVLNFSLGHPLSLHFLRRASKMGEVDVEQHTLAKYLMELTMLYHKMVHFPPQIEAGAFCLALKILDKGEWAPTLQNYLSYPEESLWPVMQHLAKNIVTVNRGLTKPTTIKNTASQ